MPAEVREAEPRLALGEAYAVMYEEPARAKALLERAFAGFTEHKDVRRQLITAAAAVDCHYFEWADFAPLDRWIAVFEQLLDPGPEYLATADALRVHGALLIALLFRQPEHPRIADTARVVEQQLAADDIELVPINDRVNAASILFNYSNWKMKGGTADALIERVEPWLTDPELSAVNRVWWQVHRAFNEQLRGHYARSRKIMSETEAFAAAHGLKWVQVEIYHAEVTALVSSDDAAGATAALGKLRAVLSPSRRMDLAYFRYQEAGVLLLQNRAREAAAAAADAVAVGRASGLPAMQIPHFLVRQASCHVRLSEIDTALALYGEAIGLATGADRRTFEAPERMLRAHVALQAGDVDGTLARLREVLAACRESGQYVKLTPEILTPLLVLALANDIEPDYVRALIRRRKLPPPGADVPGWPFPLALRAFGDFTIARDGVPLVSKGKAQKKPLELVKALIAHAAAAWTPQCSPPSSGRMPKATTPRHPSTAISTGCANCWTSMARCNWRRASSLSTRSSSGSIPGRSRRPSTPATSRRRWRCTAGTSWRWTRRCRGRCRRATGCKPSWYARCSPRATRWKAPATGSVPAPCTSARWTSTTLRSRSTGGSWCASARPATRRVR